MSRRKQLAEATKRDPKYVNGPIRVKADDPFDLDRDGNGIGCESGWLVGLYIKPAVLGVSPDPPLAG